MYKVNRTITKPQNPRLPSKEKQYSWLISFRAYISVRCSLSQFYRKKMNKLKYRCSHKYRCINRAILMNKYECVQFHTFPVKVWINWIVLGSLSSSRDLSYCQIQKQLQCWAFSQQIKFTYLRIPHIWHFTKCSSVCLTFTHHVPPCLALFTF